MISGGAEHDWFANDKKDDVTWYGNRAFYFGGTFLVVFFWQA